MEKEKGNDYLVKRDGNSVSYPTADGFGFISFSNGIGGSHRFEIFQMGEGVENYPPDTPVILSGPSYASVDLLLEYATSTIDLDEHQVYYKWDWGDSNVSEWLDTSKASHIWTTENNFEVKVMARDDHGGESDWSDPLSVSIPKTKLPINPILLQVLERLTKHFPLLIRLLNL